LEEYSICGCGVRMRKKIVTNNREIYSKLKLLNITQEVVLNSIDKKSISKILNNINKEGKILEIRHFGDVAIIKKTGTIDFDIYLKG
jgi:hypothetical protein